MALFHVSWRNRCGASPIESLYIVGPWAYFYIKPLMLVMGTNPLTEVFPRVLTLEFVHRKQARRTGMAGPLGEMFDHGKAKSWIRLVAKAHASS
jgi:hypothetical protein